MAERYLFFNSAAGDPRQYKAQDFAEYFGSVLSSGLLHTDGNPNLVVSVESGTMNTVVTPGNALIKGHLYENTTPLTLAHSIPEPTMDRIDRVVLRLDLKNQSRFIKLFVKEGQSASSPVAPALQRDAFVHELSLAQIRVRKNTVQLLASDIVDERLDENLCGIVHSLISIPSDQLQNWIQARIAELRIEADKGLTDYLQAVAIAEDALQTALQAHEANAQGLYDSYSAQMQAKLTQFETDFNAWFNSLKDQLDRNVALSLQNQINIINGALDGVEGNVAQVGQDLAAHLADDVKHITSQERTKWNSKSDFSGSYNDLTDKPQIPSLNIATGTISHGGTIPQTPGFNNYRYFVSFNNGNTNTGSIRGTSLRCSVNENRVVTCQIGGDFGSGWNYINSTANYIELAW